MNELTGHGAITEEYFDEFRKNHPAVFLPAFELLSISDKILYMNGYNENEKRLNNVNVAQEVVSYDV